MVRTLKISALATLAAAALAAQASAGEGASWIFRPPANRVQPYGPEVQRYVVVTPAPPNLPPAMPPGGPVLSHYPWQQYGLDAPVYPWGWFGAQWTPSTGSHTSYYGTYRDWNFSRGW